MNLSADVRTSADSRRWVLIAAVGWWLLNVTLVGIGMVLTHASFMGPIRRLDIDVSEWFAARRTDLLDDITSVVSRSGDTEFVVGLIVVVSICVGAVRAWRQLWLVPLAIVIELTTFLLVNSVVDRPRPPVERIGSTPSTASFPSGHVAATLVVWVGAGVLLALHEHRRWSRIVAGLGIAFALAMALARVYRGMHFLLDVLFGFAMGAAALVIAIRALEEHPAAAGDAAGTREPELSGLQRPGW